MKLKITVPDQKPFTGQHETMLNIGDKALSVVVSYAITPIQAHEDAAATNRVGPQAPMAALWLEALRDRITELRITHDGDEVTLDAPADMSACERNLKIVMNLDGYRSAKLIYQAGRDAALQVEEERGNLFAVSGSLSSIPQ